MLFDPVLVDFCGQRPHQSKTAAGVREDADDERPALYLLINPFEHIGALEVFVMLDGKTAQLHTAFGVLLVAGLIISRFI